MMLLRTGKREDYDATQDKEEKIMMPLRTRKREDYDATQDKEERRL